VRSDLGVTRPGVAAVTTLDSSSIGGYVRRAGTFVLRVRYSPYLSVTRGSVCLARGTASMTRLTATRAGPFVVQAVETPTGVLGDFLDGDKHVCRRVH
jgi:hypothetical protein